MSSDTRRRSIARRFDVFAVIGAVALSACSSGQSTDDVLSSDTAPDMNVELPDGGDLDESIDQFVEDRTPAEGASALATAWTSLANEYASAERAAAAGTSGVPDDLIETTVFSAIDLFPPGMPLPDLSYIGSVGVSPTASGCVANFQIDVGMYELDAHGIPRPYAFSRAVTLMETGFAAMGGQVLEMSDMYPDGHPVDSDAQGTQYLVDADSELWRVWIHTYRSAASALYCPAS
ncbi:MAG: hypothetical protein WD377_04260 [Nitriliruptoraceae bacterium]